MQPAPAAAALLKQLFERKPVVELADLRRALATRSRTTIFRRLKDVAYYSSYSHAGRYYTLEGIPSFDPNGLWFYGEARFSSHGTLRATVLFLVKAASAGHTLEELQLIVGLRVHDTLHSLFQATELGREEVESVFVYVDVDAQRAAIQLAQRRRAKPPTPVVSTAAPSLDLPRVIEVLVTIINHPNYTLSRVVADLQSRGVELTEAQVERVLETYGVKKTARSPSRRSRNSGRQSLR